MKQAFKAALLSSNVYSRAADYSTVNGKNHKSSSTDLNTSSACIHTASSICWLIFPLLNELSRVQ